MTVRRGLLRDFQFSALEAPWVGEGLLQKLRTLLGANTGVSGLLSVPPDGTDVFNGERRAKPPGGHIFRLPYEGFPQTPL